MGAKAKVFCGLMLFVIVFGLRFFCANCQRYPQQQQYQQLQHQQQIQMQNFQQHHLPLQQHQLHTVTVPIQKDLHSNENRLQSQVRLCGQGRLVFPCPIRLRKPFFFMLPITVRSTVPATTKASIPQMLRTGVSLVVQGSSAADVGQREFYNPNWSSVDIPHRENQHQHEPGTQHLPGKNCKRKRRPQPSPVSTTEAPLLSPLQQYWRGHVEDEIPTRGRQKIPTTFQEPSPTQTSDRLQEPSTTKITERIGEALSSMSSEVFEDPLATQNPERQQNVFPSQYPEIRRPPTNGFSEKIREFNPTKESLILRQPITSTIFDKLQDPLPMRIYERNKDYYSTQPAAEHFVQDPTPTTRILEKTREAYSPRPIEENPQSGMSEKAREPNSKKTFDRNHDQSSTRIREPLAALEKEQKLSEERDKQRQQSSSEKSTGSRDKSYRRPYSQAKKEQSQQSSASKEESSEVKKSPKPRLPMDLKEILKSSGGLSLSEILQQKNLSLDDLLKGKQTALLALQTTAASPEKHSDVISSKERFGKPVRRIPSLGLSAALSTTTSTTTTTTTETNLIDQSLEETSAQSSEVSQEEQSEEISSNESTATKIPTTLRKNLKFPSRIRTIPTTRRQQHFETTLQQRFSTTTTTTQKPSTTRIPLYKKRQHTRLPLMRAPGLKKVDPTTATGSESLESSPSRETSQSQEETSTPNYSKRFRTRKPSSTTTETILDLTDPSSNLVDYSPGDNEVLQESDNTFENASLSNNNSLASDSDNLIAKSTEEPVTDHIYRYNSLKDYIDNNLPHAVLMDIDLADIDPVDDRTDLLELIEDRRSGNRLIKVLEQRNMTLEELIEHRKRGSSQLHLATFVQNRSGVFPGKKVVVNDDMDIVTAFENFPHFNLLNLKSVKPDEIKTDSQGSSYFTSIIDIEPTDDSSKEFGSGGTSPGKPSIRNPKSSNIQRQPFYPSWKSLALASLTTSENAKRFLQQRSELEPPQQTAQRHQAIVSEEDPIVQIEDEVARAHDLIDLELSGHGFKRSAMNLMHTSEVPSGIRSAMVASAAIVLTSLISFMVVFVACRWKQRRRRHKLDYLEAYSVMRNCKLPMKSSRRTRSDDLATSTTSLGMESSSAGASRTSRSNSRQSQRHQISIVFPGNDGDYLTGPSCSKLDPLDPNSPQVQDYLFNSMRKSF